MSDPRNVLPSNDYIQSLNTARPDGNHDDLIFLNKLIDDATVVGLGEVTHGISECFQLKHRLIEYLVKEKGFSIFSIEANMPEAYRINDYILNGIGDPRTLIAEMGFWTWNTQEIFEMIEWMRDYNKTANIKIQFTGFDSQSMDLPAEIIKKNIGNDTVNELVDSAIKIINHLKSRYENCEFTQPEIDIIKSAIIKDSQYHALKANLTSLEKYLQENKISLVKQLGMQSFLWTQQNLILLTSSYEGLTDPLGTRDRTMAENVLWIKSQNSQAKIILWAHNGHIQKQSFLGKTYPPMGHYLKEKLGDYYRTIGFVAYEGSYAAKDWSDGFKLKRDLKLHEPPSNSLEARIKALSNNAENPILLLDLHHPNKPQWLSNRINARLELGSIMEGNKTEYSFSNYDISAGYDGMIYLGTTHAAQPIKQSHEYKQSEETTPQSGMFKPATSPQTNPEKPPTHPPKGGSSPSPK